MNKFHRLYPFPAWTAHHSKHKAFYFKLHCPSEKNDIWYIIFFLTTVNHLIFTAGSVKSTERNNPWKACYLNLLSISSYFRHLSWPIITTKYSFKEERWVRGGDRVHVAVSNEESGDMCFWTSFYTFEHSQGWLRSRPFIPLPGQWRHVCTWLQSEK